MKKENINILKRTILIILIIINCVTIFCFSAQEADESSITSGIIVDKVIGEIYKNKKDKSQEVEKAREIITKVVRKSAHFTIYMFLGVFTFLYMNTYEIQKKNKFLYTIAFCLIYACSDEIHQRFVEGRSCELRDVCIDTCGSIIGAFLSSGIIKIKCLIIHQIIIQRILQKC